MIDGIDRPPTLTDVAADALRHAVFRGELKPGQALPEGELSEMLRVSRSTIRDALNVLKQDGLVEAVPHKGARVIQVSGQTIRDVYTLRILLEPHCVRAAMESRAYPIDVLTGLRSLVLEMGEAERRGDVFSLIRLDLQFHQSICAVSGEPLLQDTLRSVGSLSRLCMINIKIFATDPVTDEQQHGEILDAIQKGDLDKAEDAVRAHLEYARQALLSRMKETGWDSVQPD